MKRSLFLAALATLTSGAALAQSNVTIYGRLNVTAERQKDGDTTLNVLQNNSSRIGFKGTEDLGGGLKAFFLIEHGFSPDDGRAATTFWGRESNVGLEGSFGRVRLGNMGPTAAYFATADYISMHNHDTGTSSDAFYLYPGDVRNTIAYATPNISGFTGEAQMGLKEAANTKHTFVLAGNYDAGPLHLGAAYVSAPTGLIAPPASGDDHKEFGIRGLYEMGPFTVGAYYINNRIDDGAGNSLKRNAIRLAAMYAMGASEFHANFGKASNFKANGTTVDDTGASQFTLGYNYNLSKRTKVYGFYTQVSNNDFAVYSVSTPGTKFSSLAVGVRHNF